MEHGQMSSHTIHVEHPGQDWKALPGTYELLDGVDIAAAAAQDWPTANVEVRNDAGRPVYTITAPAASR